MSRWLRTGWSRGVALALGLIPAVVAGPALTQTAATEQPAKASVRVAPVIIAEPEVETALSIQIGPEGAVPRQTYLRIRGLPLSAKLTEGHVVSPGVWAVPLSAVATLRLLAPLSGSGRTELNLALVSVDGGVIAEARSSLVVAPAWLLSSAGTRQDPRTLPANRPEAPAPTTTPAVTAPVPAPPLGKPVAQATPVTAPAPAPEPKAVPLPPPVVRQAAIAPMPVPPPPQPAMQPAPVVAALPPPRPPAAQVAPPPPPPPVAAPAPPPVPQGPAPISTADRPRAEGLVQRGDTFLGQGNVAAARQFYRRAADMGLGLAALRLGATFDPVELAGIRAVGVQPDPKEAAVWYERARALGEADAGARLSRLQGR